MKKHILLLAAIFIGSVCMAQEKGTPAASNKKANENSTEVAKEKAFRYIAMTILTLLTLLHLRVMALPAKSKTSY